MPILKWRVKLTKGNVPGLREIVAEYSHDSWVTWMTFLFKQSFTIFGYTVIPPHMTKRWIRQMHTKYHDLTEQERVSDRREADKLLERLVEGYKA